MANERGGGGVRRLHTANSPRGGDRRDGKMTVAVQSENSLCVTTSKRLDESPV